MYSLLLGRPAMMRKEAFDVAAPPKYQAAGQDLHATFQAALARLSNLIGEAIEKVGCHDSSPPFFPTD